MTRPRLQLHLSTLLIVSLLAAGLVWLNVRVYYLSGLPGDEVYARGWPNAYYQQASDATAFHVWSVKRLWGNFAICLALLAVAAAAIEWATRRMKRGAS
jgi:hypothetical protein